MHLSKSALSFVFLVANCNANRIEETVGRYKKTTPESVYIPQNIGAITTPENYHRITLDGTAFGTYLRSVPIKKDRKVYLFNGNLKQNQAAQYAVLDVSVGKKDLQQCADAVMRLRAEFLYRSNKMDQIVFIDNERKQYKFLPPFTRTRFDSYLQKVFGMCGSASLEMQLQPKKDLNQMNIGDVFIKGGFPGHAVIIVDIAENDRKEKVFMIAQSYMPAQDIHILKNYYREDVSPWYAVNDIEKYLYTPEYTFTNKQLRTW